MVGMRSGMGLLLGLGLLLPPPPAALAADPPGAGLVVARGRIEPVEGVRALGVYAGVPAVTLLSMLVREGEQVAEGQLLATAASHAAAQAAVAVAAATLALAERRLEQARRPWREGQLQAVRANVTSRRADLNLAERQLQRSEDLVRRAVRSTMDYEERIAEANRARAQLAEAEAQVNALVTVSPLEIQVAEASRDEAAARLAQAEAEARLAEVRAPLAGTGLRLLARAGDVVTNRPILEMADLTKLEVVAELEERLLPRIRPGQPAEVQMPGGGARTRAEVGRIGHQVRLLERAQSDLLTGAGGRMVELHLPLPPGSPLPPVVGLEVLVRITAP